MQNSSESVLVTSEMIRAGEEVLDRRAGPYPGFYSPVVAEEVYRAMEGARRAKSCAGKDQAPARSDTARSAPAR